MLAPKATRHNNIFEPEGTPNGAIEKNEISFTLVLVTFQHPHSLSHTQLEPSLEVLVVTVDSWLGAKNS